MGRLTEKERDEERIMEKYREVDLVNFDYSAKISYIWNIFNTMEINSYLDDPNRTVFIIFLKIVYCYLQASMLLLMSNCLKVTAHIIIFSNVLYYMIIIVR